MQVSKPAHNRSKEIFQKDISKLVIGIVVLLAINIFSKNYFFRLDLTEEKRYSITDATKNLLGNLDNEVEVQVYLAGDLPAGFQRLQRGIREMLDEFEVYSNGNVRYSFIDPMLAVPKEERRDFIMELGKKGIQPTNVFDTENGKRIQKLLLPGALINYEGKQIGVNLLNGDQTAGSQEALNQSIERLEYELVTAIGKLTIVNKPKVGLVTGHGELTQTETAGLVQDLSEYYDLHTIDLPRSTTLDGYEAILINKPTKPFSEQDKFKVDQFIMKGGKVLFFIDKLQVNMDSLQAGGTVALPYNLNLEDQLFHYGIRVNNDLIQDMKCAKYPVVVGNVGNQPQIVPLPWAFFPLVNNYADHPIVKNLDVTYLRFTNSIDTVKAEGILKTPLIYTSPYTRKLANPVLVDLNELRDPPKPELFTGGEHAVAYLLEGSFSSLFRNRVLPQGAHQSEFQEQGIPSKILVCSDGDILANEINPQNGNPYPLGYEPFTKRNFANKDFINNALAYLTDAQGIINARAKEIKIRPLDPVKVDEERVMWQFINLLLPLILITVYGLIRYYFRKRKFSIKIK